MACLKGEGIPDECLSFFKTTEGYEKCNEKLNENPALELETNIGEVYWSFQHRLVSIEDIRVNFKMLKNPKTISDLLIPAFNL